MKIYYTLLAAIIIAYPEVSYADESVGKQDLRILVNNEDTELNSQSMLKRLEVTKSDLYSDDDFFNLIDSSLISKDSNFLAMTLFHLSRRSALPQEKRKVLENLLLFSMNNQPNMPANAVMKSLPSKDVIIGEYTRETMAEWSLIVLREFPGGRSVAISKTALNHSSAGVVQAAIRNLNHYKSPDLHDLMRKIIARGEIDKAYATTHFEPITLAKELLIRCVKESEFNSP